MSDDKKTIDFKNAKLGLFNKKLNKNQRINNNNNILRGLDRVPPPPVKNKPLGKVSNTDEILRQREQDMRAMRDLQRRVESEEYTARVLQIAHDVFVRSQPQLLQTEEERLALAESAVQSGQAFYRMAKEFIEYVATEDFIHSILEEEK